MAIQITETFALFHDLEGDPLAAGRVFIGQPNLDAEAHPKEVFFDAAMTIAASQPIRTNAGRLVNGSGQLARIYTDGDFSIIAKDAGSVTVFSAENGQTENDNAITSLMAVAGDIVTGTGFDSVSELLASSLDFGANTHNGEGVTITISAGDIFTVKGVGAFKAVTSGGMATGGDVRVEFIGVDNVGYLPAYGALPNTNSASALQAADDSVVALGGKVRIPFKSYDIESTVHKHSMTHWEGDGRGQRNTTDKVKSGETQAAGTGPFGSVVNAAFNGDLVVMNDAATTYKTGRMSDLRFVSNLSTYPAAVAIKMQNGIRQQNFDRLNIFGFSQGFSVQGGGELHFSDVFVSGGDYSWRFNGGADSWFWGCHGGDGSGVNPAAYTGSLGYGFHFNNGANNMHLMACRPQVSGKYGLYIEDGLRFQIVSNTIDQSNVGGAIITGNSDQIQFVGGQAFDNGTTAVNGAAISLVANAGETIGSVSCDSMNFFDRNRGTASQRQDRGINVFTAATGRVETLRISGCDFTGVDKGIRIAPGSNIDTLIVEGCDFTGCDTPIDGLTSANVGQIIVTGNSGIYGQSSGFVTSANADLVATPETPQYVRFTGTLTANRTFTLPTVGMVDGTIFNISREAVGDFYVIIKVAGGSDKAILSADGTSVKAIYGSGGWQIMEWPTVHRVSTAKLSSVTDRVNTIHRPMGARLINHTSFREYWSTGPAAGAAWRNPEDSTTIVPS